MVQFNQYLEGNKLLSWSQSYLNYYILKTYLKNKQLTLFDQTLTTELTKVEDFYHTQLDRIDLEDIDESYEEADKLRQYIILNVIGFIKIIKKRNKNIPDDLETIDAGEKLSSYQFYQCQGLKEKFTTLLEQGDKENSAMLQKHFQHSNSFRILSGYHKFQPSFSLYSNLPFCDTEFVKRYLTSKLDSNQKSDKGEENKCNSNDSNDNSNNTNTTTNGLHQILEIETQRESNTLSNIPPEEISKWTLYQRYFTLLLSLYSFLFGLGLMGDSFKAMSGASMGYFFSAISNPISGLMIGILATVLLQSSSTTTSIIVSMVGADLVTVQKAIPVIMGANIGTSVTNTIVSQGHIRNVEEFKRAFAGATVHDLFNLLSVLILLPFNIISGALGYPFFERFTHLVTGLFANVEAGTFKSPIKIIVSPLTKLFLKVDKDVIKAHAKGCVECQPNMTLIEVTSDNGYCIDIEGKNCITHQDWTTELEDTSVIKSGFCKQFGEAASFIGLFFSLTVLCISIYFLIKTLQKLVIGNAGSQGWVVKTLQKIMNKSPYLSMLFGIVLTIMVQSSSITTSTFTPLVGLNLISLEQMFPLTLGANIGTTCTAFLAALVSGKVNAIQIALCHFFFNIIGILIWFPHSGLRKIPLQGAQILGEYITKYKWFGFFYLGYVFVLMPLLLWVVSLLFNIDQILTTLLGITLIVSILLGSLTLFYKFDHVLEKIEKVLRP